ncbi:hypothetical protein GCM10023232_02170 [Sphingosinicella ginsenosidimutans]|uniref:Porin n=1 Tax=Allosphingosinicella ginsenosidimutans TaxID=1176539 RepID=A0A5C6TUU1_9SPHN|nr:hypothetical protein [Sphingosinicella ginsenosidimutans]TXC64107.1 hypothetical protein FRZ32_10830 [Sphingosinicella ginsenosidimutans]
MPGSFASFSFFAASLLAIATGAAAQRPPRPLPLLRIAPPSPPPRFVLPRDQVRDLGRSPRNGLIAAYPLRSNLELGIGRYRVGGQHRPPTNTAGDSPQRRRGVAAIGLSLSF